MHKDMMRILWRIKLMRHETGHALTRFSIISNLKAMVSVYTKCCRNRVSAKRNRISTRSHSHDEWHSKMQRNKLFWISGPHNHYGSYVWNTYFWFLCFVSDLKCRQVSSRAHERFFTCSDNISLFACARAQARTWKLSVGHQERRYPPRMQKLQKLADLGVPEKKQESAQKHLIENPSDNTNIGRLRGKKHNSRLNLSS